MKYLPIALLLLMAPVILFSQEQTCLQGDCKNGKGKLKLADGRVYEGNFVNGIMDYHIKSKLTWPAGDAYFGQVKDGNRVGEGEMTWKAGDSYKGLWKEDKRHGQGMMKWKSGDAYTGNWANDVFDGSGHMTWKIGDSYDGTWVNNQMDGFGTFIWKNGVRYIGNWSKGQMNGDGRLIQANGRVINGKWIAGKYDGDMNPKKAQIPLPSGIYRVLCHGNYLTAKITFSKGGKADEIALAGEGKGNKYKKRWQVEGDELYVYFTDEQYIPMGDPEIYIYDKALKSYCHKGQSPTESCVIKK